MKKILIILLVVIIWTPNFSLAQEDLVFMHHSVGSNWLQHSLNNALLTKDFIDERNDIYYGTTISPDTGRPASLGGAPGDSTNMNHWVRWFNDYLQGVKIHGCSNGYNRIVMFKSCYPNSNIVSDGNEPGNPFSSTRTLANYRAIYRHPDGPGNIYSRSGSSYKPLEDIFAENQDILFIPVSAPPRHYAPLDATNDAEAHRARLFNNWLKNEWLANYNTMHPDLNNVAVFDLFDILAYPDDHSSHPNRLRAEYGGESGDSHPNSTANSILTQFFATESGNFIDISFENYLQSGPNLNAPINCTASDDNCDIIAVSWEYSWAGHDGFKIYRDNNEIGSVSSIERVFNDIISPGQVFQYSIRAFNIEGNSPSSNSDNGYRVTVPQAPENLSITDTTPCTEQEYTLSWDRSDEAILYRVYENDIIVYEGSDMLYVTSKSGGEYHYKVTAGNGCGWSTYGDIIFAAIRLLPSSPENCVASDNDCNLIAISWTWNDDNYDGFRIFRDNIRISSVDPENRIYNDYNVQPGISHSYFVKAFNNCGDGFQSNSDTGYRERAIIYSPINVRASDDQCDVINVAWDWVGEDCDGFKIFRDDAVIDSVESDRRTFTDFSTSRGIDYSYYIRAFDNCGLGPLSDPDDGIALGPPDGNFSSFSATDENCNEVSLSWEYNSANCQVDSFKIYRDSIRIITLTSYFNSYIDSDAPEGISHYYEVYAINRCGIGDSSAADYGFSIPVISQAPVNIQADDDACDFITITWLWEINYNDGFRLFRNDSLIADLLQDARNFEDSDVMPGAIYGYKLLGYNQCGDGPLSESDNGNLKNIPSQVELITPPNDTSFQIETGTVEFVWQRAEYADSSYFVLATSPDLRPNSIVFDSILYSPVDTTLEITLEPDRYYWAVMTAVCSDIASSDTFGFEASMTGITSVDGLIPEEYFLSQSYPNPFNPITIIPYGLPEDSYVKIKIYDIQGRLIRSLVDSYQKAGYKKTIWDGFNNSDHEVSSGIYFYSIEARDFNQTKKMTVLR